MELEAGNPGNFPIKAIPMEYRTINGGFTGMHGCNDTVTRESGAGRCLRAE